MANCTFDLDGSKKTLNVTYGLLAKGMDRDHLSALEKAQRSWLEYRVAECAFEAGGNPGSTGNSSDVIECTARMNRQRAAELKGMADQSKSAPN